MNNLEVKLSDFYYNDDIEENEIPSIVDTYDVNFLSVVDRFFTKYYYKKCPKIDNEDHQILFHSNRICLIGLSSMHEAMKKTIVNVNFDIGNVDRSQNNVKGKGKKGAMNLQPTSTLAIIKCSDGTEYNIVSCITGKLIEINSKLLQNPELIKTEGDGYVAVVLPKPENCDGIKAKLLTELQYFSDDDKNNT